MKSGVYRIRNTVSGKSYIGSSVNIPLRWKAHKRELRGQYHCNPHLQHAWNKYESSEFEFTVILYCDAKDCMTYEQIALDYFKPAYNICLDARGAIPGREHRVQFNGKNNPFYGKRHSDDTKLAMSRSGRGEKHSQTRLTWNDVEEIRNSDLLQRELAKRFGVTQTTISKIKTGRTWIKK